MSAVITGVTDRGSYSVSFQTENVGLDATRLAAVIVTRRGAGQQVERPRGWLRRLLGGRPRRPAPEASVVQYDQEEREVRVLDRRWPLPRGELALAIVVDLTRAGAPPEVATRTFAASAVPRERFKADPRAPRRKNMKRLLEHEARRRQAEEQAWRAALRADPELVAFLSPEIESFLGAGARR